MQRKWANQTSPNGEHKQYLALHDRFSHIQSNHPVTIISSNESHVNTTPQTGQMCIYITWDLLHHIQLIWDILQYLRWELISAEGAEKKDQSNTISIYHTAKGKRANICHTTKTLNCYGRGHGVNNAARRKQSVLIILWEGHEQWSSKCNGETSSDPSHWEGGAISDYDHTSKGTHVDYHIPMGMHSSSHTAMGTHTVIITFQWGHTQ